MESTVSYIEGLRERVKQKEKKEKRHKKGDSGIVRRLTDRWEGKGWVHLDRPSETDELKQIVRDVRRKMLEATEAEKEETETIKGPFKTRPAKAAKEGREEESRVADILLAVMYHDTGKPNPPTKPTGLYPSLPAEVDTTPTAPPPYSPNNPFSPATQAPALVAATQAPALMAPIRQIKGGYLDLSLSIPERQVGRQAQLIEQLHQRLQVLEEEGTSPCSSASGSMTTHYSIGPQESDERLESVSPAPLTTTGRPQSDNVKRKQAGSREEWDQQGATGVKNDMTNHQSHPYDSPAQQSYRAAAERQLQELRLEREQIRQREYDQSSLQRPQPDGPSSQRYSTSFAIQHPAFFHVPAASSTPCEETRTEIEIRELEAEVYALNETFQREGSPQSYAVGGILTGKVTPVTPVATRTRQRVHDQQKRETEDNQQPLLTLPLRPVPSAGGAIVFNPFTFGDLEALTAKLPSLHGGAAPWMSAFQVHTQGNALALGDIRAVLGRCSDGHTADTLLASAGMAANAPDATPFAHFSAVFWKILRRAYPTPVDRTIVTSLKCGPDESPDAYMGRAKVKWQESFMEPYDHSPTTLALWRQTVVNGLPEGAKTQCENVVGLQDMDGPMWASQIRHHLTKYQKGMKGQDEELKGLHKRLLKKQIAELESKEAKSKQTTAKQMTSAPDDIIALTQLARQLVIKHSHPDLHPDTWSPQGVTPQQQQQWLQKPGREGYRGRGRGSSGPRTTFFCYSCGKPGHYARDCRSSGRGGPQGGRGQQQGSYRGRGGMSPYPHPPPPGPPQGQRNDQPWPVPPPGPSHQAYSQDWYADHQDPGQY